MGRSHHRTSTAVIIAAVALALALLAAPRPLTVRSRAGLPRVGHRDAPSHPFPAQDPLAAASSLDVLAVCLSAGMPVPVAASATASSAPSQLAALLRHAADLLALGADPATAWAPQPGVDLDEHSLALLRLARRSAASGAALAVGVAELAAQHRQEAAHRAEAAAERASVVIAGPLGLCFLPAFICLGLVPVIAGLARNVLGSGFL
jgi:pilus assembly protein TadC